MTEKIELRQLVQLQRGQSYKSALLGQPGPFLLGLGTIQRNGGFRGENLKTYGGDSPKKTLLRSGDLYVSLKDVTHSADLLGAVARVPKNVELGRLTQDTIRLDVDDSRVDRNYLHWLLRTPDFREYCRARGTGTTNLDLSRDDFLAYQVVLPSRLEQEAVASLLEALDEKVAANNNLIGTSDQLSHTLFRAMRRSDCKLVPLSETAKFVNGKAFTKNASGTGRVVIRIAELNSGIGASTVYNDIEVDDHHLARPGDLLFAWSGSLTLHRWFRSEGIVNQHIFKVMPNDGYPHWLVHELLREKLDEFKSIAADKATTMGHIQRKHLDEPVAVPSPNAVSKHNVLMAALWSRTLVAERENLGLNAARDALLPHLVSGTLRVQDARKLLEKAGV
ncbi:hypothetical protein QMY03_11955 [Arthrobacter sp. KFRI-F3372]|nr:hypothetical protein QMY03_11955 [Arthrobacter sp. KFRI-F3372]